MGGMPYTFGPNIIKSYMYVSSNRDDTPSSSTKANLVTDSTEEGEQKRLEMGRNEERWGKGKQLSCQSAVRVVVVDSMLLVTYSSIVKAR